MHVHMGSETLEMNLRIGKERQRMLGNNNSRKRNTSSGVRACRRENGDFELPIAKAHELKPQISENIASIWE